MSSLQWKWKGNFYYKIATFKQTYNEQNIARTKLFCFYFQLSEIANGVWCCPVRVKALINSVGSRTALACGMLNIFYPREVLTGKRLKDLDKKVVHAIAGKLIIFRILQILMFD